MAINVDGMRDRWERMNPREQRLLMLLGIALVVCLVAAVVFYIQNGMAATKRQNDESREALRALEVYRNAKAEAERATSGAAVAFPKKALELDSYLDDIITELQLESPTYPKVKKKTKDSFTEASIEVKLRGLTIQQLADFFERVESRSPFVAVTALNIDTNFKDKEKLDLDFTITTFAEEDKAAKTAKDGDNTKDKEEAP